MIGFGFRNGAVLKQVSIGSVTYVLAPISGSNTQPKQHLDTGKAACVHFLAVNKVAGENK